MNNFEKMAIVNRIQADAIAEAKAEGEKVFFDYLFYADKYGLDSEALKDVLTIIETKYDFYGFQSCGICDKRSGLASVSFWV